MKKKLASKSAFFNQRVLIGFSLCLLGLVLALLAFSLYPGGNAFARQDQPAVPAAPVVEQRNAAAPQTKLPQVDEALMTAIPLAPGNLQSQPAPLVPNLVGVDKGTEIEPNNTFATANALGANPEGKIRANSFGVAAPVGTDEDWFSFTTTAASSKIYAATVNSSASQQDSVLEVFASNGTTVLELDDQDGSFGGSSSSIAGTVLATPGTYYLRVTNFSTSAPIAPYDLYFAVRSVLPTAETEPNNNGTPQVLPASQYVSGVIDPLADSDTFTFTANAGDTVFISLDLDPERDVTTFNGRCGLGVFGTPGQLLVTGDGGTFDTIDSEAMVMTVDATGTYTVYVDSQVATAGATQTYNFNVTTIPAAAAGTCTTYTNAVSTAIPDLALTTSTIVIPDSKIIRSLRAIVDITHPNFPDLDVHLRSPATGNNDNGLFTDVGVSTQTGPQNLDLNDEAALPILFTNNNGMIYQPEGIYRLAWFKGENSLGTWSLDIRDDSTTVATPGTLNSWSLIVCEEPALTGSVVYTQDFEANNGGYVATGTVGATPAPLAEWEYGTPATVATSTANPVAPFLNCASGVSCWKTDLDSTYDSSSIQDLTSPSISLAGVTGPINLYWQARYQMESVSFDRIWVRVTEIANPTHTRIVWHSDNQTMVDSVGSPAVNIPASAGWGRYSGVISDFAGQAIQVTFHLESDSSINFGGFAIDDVSVRGTVASTPTPTPTASPTATPTASPTPTPTGTPGGTATPTPSPGGVPANDQCAGAIVIPPAGPFPHLTAAVDVTLATTTGDPPLPSCQTSVSRSIWYTFTPAVTGSYTISSCQSEAPASTLPDDVLTIYTAASCAGPFTQLPGTAGCDDDTCVTLGLQAIIANTTLNAGTQYFILADKFGTTAPTAGAASIQMRISLAGAATPTPTPTGTPCANPTTTFSNSAPITIAATTAPYPSDILVAGVTGSVSKVTVTLTGLNHAFIEDVDVLLVGPGGQKFILLSDTFVGGGTTTNVTWTFDDAAAALVPGGAGTPTSGSFRPTNYGAGDTFPATAPAGPYLSPATAGTDTLAAFNGVNPNGTWHLYVVDDFPTLDDGTMSGGWSLSISSGNCPTPTPTPTPGGTPTPTPGPGVDCATQPGIIIHDDGTEENGYGANPATVATFNTVDKFTPTTFPAAVQSACVAFLTIAGTPTTLNYSVIVYDDDGAGGAPGTQLGVIADNAVAIPGGLGVPVFQTTDLSSLGLSVASGSVYIGVRYTPSNPNVFVASDESAGHPIGFAGGFMRFDLITPPGPGAWTTTQTSFPAYRSLFVRAVFGAGGGPTPTPSPTPTATPCTIPVTVSYTGPAVVITDNIPAGVNVPLLVSGVTGTVADLNFRLDSLAGCSATLGDANAGLTHSWVGDIILKITPPDGSPTVTIIDRPGATALGFDGNNFCTTLLDDEGGFPSIDTVSTAPVSGNFSPQNPLSALDGENPNGTWTINVSDNAALDTGTLNRFSLIFGVPCPSPTPSATPTATVAPTATPSPTATAGGTATPTPPAAPPAQALNLSTRMNVQTGDRVGIGGFIITGSGPKYLLLRAIGPSLARYDIFDFLPDPVLELHGPGAFVTVINNDWRDTQEDEIQATGIPPTNDRESAIVKTLAPGAYTAIVRGNGPINTGIALVELYDLDQGIPGPAGNNTARLANMSTRAFVSTGDKVVIAGFILGNNGGDGDVIIRGLGPSLTAAGVTSVLANPTLELRDTNGTLLISNNDWQDNPAQAAEITAAGLAPSNALEAAIAATLPPGLYTSLLAGLNGGVGNGLVEVYDLHAPPGPTPGPTATPGGTPTPTPGGPTATPGGTPTPTPAATPTPSPAPPFAENFDGQAALPPGWVAENAPIPTSTGTPIPATGAFWVTATTNFVSSPNSAFVVDQGNPSDKRLISPNITITTSGANQAVLTFQNKFNTEQDFDGGVLEVSSPNINGGAFTDVTDAAVGGTIPIGDYTGTIDGTLENDTPLRGRPAWTGDSVGYHTSEVHLGTIVNGQTIKLRWRMGSDDSVGGPGVDPGWHIDDVSLAGGSLAP